MLLYAAKADLVIALREREEKQVFREKQRKRMLKRGVCQNVPAANATQISLQAGPGSQ